MSGNIPAQTTANMVMASAKRLMELRQPCLKRRRIAEINVPAWPIPIHQSKQLIRKSHTTATRSAVATLPAMPKNMNQPSGVCGVSTIREIFSVTDLKVWPGPMTRNSPVAGSTPGSVVFTSLVAIVNLTLCRCVFHRRFFEFGVRINDRGHIRGRGAVVEIGKHLVAALVGAKFCNPALLVVDVAEGDGRGRARLLAGGYDFAVAYRTVLLVRIDLGFVDALHAVAALLHYAAPTHGDVGVAHQREALGFVIGEEQEVEAAHLVGAVVGAVSSAHAAVVDHGVEAFRRVHRCADRADLLARRILAVLAGHGLEVCAGRGKIAFKVCIDTQPLHVAADAYLLLADYGNVVLGVAADDAGVAAGAAVHVDRHAPAAPGRRPSP